MAAIDELATLRQRRAELQRQSHDTESRLTFASQVVEQARMALAETERRRLTGDATEADVQTATKRLAKAKTEAIGDATPERLQGARAAVRDLDAQIGRFATEHYAELRDAVNEEAMAASERVDRALTELQSAHRERELHSQAAHELLALVVARVRPGVVPPERGVVEAAVAAADAADLAGGSRPPVLPESFLPAQAEPLPDDSWTTA